jgi:hypothetical protein
MSLQWTMPLRHSCQRGCRVVIAALAGWLAGTGKRIRINGHRLWKIDYEGVVAESKAHLDPAEYNRQVKHGFDYPISDRPLELNPVITAVCIQFLSTSNFDLLFVVWDQ